MLLLGKFLRKLEVFVSLYVDFLKKRLVFLMKLNNILLDLSVLSASRIKLNGHIFDLIILLSKLFNHFVVISLGIMQLVVHFDIVGISLFDVALILLQLLLSLLSNLNLGLQFILDNGELLVKFMELLDLLSEV